MLLLLLVLGYCPLHAQNDDAWAFHGKHIVQKNNPNEMALAMQYFESQVDIKLNQGDSLYAIYALRYLAMGNYHLGNYYEAEANAVDAFKIIDQIDKGDTLIESRKALYNQLGRTYDELVDFEKSRNAYSTALQFASTPSDSAPLFNNIGNTYYNEKRYPAAKASYTLALNQKVSKENPEQKAMILDNLGTTKTFLNEMDALLFLKESLALRKKDTLLEGLYSSYKNLALYYQKQKHPVFAKTYADSALQIARHLKSGAFLKDAYALHLDLGNASYAQAFKKLSDSLELQKQLISNKNAALKYNVEKERKKTEAIEQEKIRQENLRILYQILGILILVLALFLLYYLRTKQKQHAQQQVQDSESRISKKVHDEVANEVYGAMARLQDDTTPKKEVLDHLELIYHKTRDISKEHNPIDYDEDFGHVLSDLVLTYQSDQVYLTTRNLSKVDWHKLNKLKKSVLYRVLQELLTNMKKHSQASVVALSFAQQGRKVLVEYADNGKGCDLKKQGGLRNAETRIESVKGKITFETKPQMGFKAKITL